MNERVNQQGTGSPTDPAAAVKSVDRLLVDAHLLGNLFARVKPLLVANIGTAFFLTLVLWDETVPLYLVVWALGLSGWTMMRFVLARLYLRQPRAAAETPKWTLLFSIGSGIGGTLWGISALFFIGFDPEAAKLPMALVMAGLSVAALAGYSKNLRAFAAFIAPALLPYGGALIYLNGSFDPAIAGYFGLWFVLVWIMAVSIHAGFRDFVALEIHNQGLMRTLSVERDRAEAASQAKTRFLANMGHEFRTPLNAIIGCSEMIVQKIFGPVGNDHYHEYAGDIHSSGQQLLKVVEEILDVSSLETDAIEIAEEDVDLAPLLHAIADRYAGQVASENITMTIQADTGLPHLKGDAAKLMKMMDNLVSNAVKYTPDGGDIRASLRQTESGVEFSVHDTGIGIAEEDLAQVCVPFAKLENRDHLNRVRALKDDRGQTSNGLGLPLARLLAERHGGSLTLESTQDVGTTARIHLPETRIVPRDNTLVSADRQPRSAELQVRIGAA